MLFINLGLKLVGPPWRGGVRRSDTPEEVICSMYLGHVVYGAAAKAEEKRIASASAAAAPLLRGAPVPIPPTTVTAEHEKRAHEPTICP